MHNAHIVPVYGDAVMPVRYLPMRKEREMMLYGVPHKRITITLSHYVPRHTLRNTAIGNGACNTEHFTESATEHAVERNGERVVVSLWVEENRTDPFIELLMEVGLIPYHAPYHASS
ncbi:hypothetical protein NEFER03_0198 [Nematocida sp. LUAm3]|nr:hypothetical protein NEFER03_0198 [Nematocida sp. LUAm3]KAI5173651.1 hypothetical protein NEFER02_0167 [Nematocida sp. LUAm2]KAI5176872.1 hypothetical protein NEFER01_0197 [Nematocida sp. LUAm1]